MQSFKKITKKLHQKSRLLPAIALLFAATALTAQSCSLFQTRQDQQPDPVELTYWSVFRDKSDMEDLIAAYKQIKPHVTITYKKLDYAEYEEELINGFSLDRGPDMFSIHNDWLPEYQQRLAPAPEDLISAATLEQNFAEVASNDLVADGQVYGVPLSIDTLALYYNKDHFDQENIPSPPETWTEFRDNVVDLTRTDDLGNFTRHGAAIGTAENINRSIDILYLLMLQNGAQITNSDQTAAAFNTSRQTADNETYFPGREALTFYTNFAAPSKDTYTWNPRSDYSIDAFAEGKAAMMINYSFHAPTIRAIAPDLNFDIVPVPQIAGAEERGERVNFANYFAETVSNKSANQREAWEFLNFISQREQLALYLDATGLPTSRRDMVNDQLQDPDLGVFAQQILTSESVYKPDANAVDNIFAGMIESVNLGNATAEQAIGTAAQRVNALFIGN